MKKPLVVSSNDWHIRDDNVNQIIDLFRQQCQLAVSLEVKFIACLGDIFNSRKSQTLLVLNTFTKILNIANEYHLNLICFPGNHDKTCYESRESFLDQFRYHPNITLLTDYGNIELDGVRFHFMPFFSENMWIDEFKNVEFIKGEQNILLSHIAVTGSRNNDGAKVESPITPSMFRKFDIVGLGHYHNYQSIGSNIFHFPSIQQNNYGEDTNKGFTVIYDDCTFDLRPSTFKRYEVVDIDLNETSKKQISELINTYSERLDESYVRFRLTGTEDKLKAFDKESIKLIGIDVKTVNKEIDSIEDFDSVEVKRYTNESIMSEFKNFCEEYEKDYEAGLKYLVL